jgi:FkbM family methyltransferase
MPVMALSYLLVRLHLWYAGRGWTWSALLLSRLHPRIESLTQEVDCWRLETTTKTYYLSDPSQLVRVVGFGIDMEHRVFPKYTFQGFVEVETGDVVIDVGAFIGEFSMRAVKRADRLVAVEPDKRNAAALSRNLGSSDGVDVVNRAVWKESGKLTFNVAGDPSEGSILSVDDSGVNDSVSLDAVSIANLADEYGLEHVDFLKLEAEGAEPEALKGIGDLEVRKIAVECSPERDGESPIEEVRALLVDRGYTTQLRDNVLFARLED